MLHDAMVTNERGKREKEIPLEFALIAKELEEQTLVISALKEVLHPASREDSLEKVGGKESVAPSLHTEIGAKLSGYRGSLITNTREIRSIMDNLEL